jgi:hypothetical protein
MMHQSMMTIHGLSMMTIHGFPPWCDRQVELGHPGALGLGPRSGPATWLCVRVQLGHAGSQNTLRWQRLRPLTRLLRGSGCRRGRDDGFAGPRWWWRMAVQSVAEVPSPTPRYCGSFAAACCLASADASCSCGSFAVPSRGEHPVAESYVEKLDPSLNTPHHAYSSRPAPRVVGGSLVTSCGWG